MNKPEYYKDSESEVNSTTAEDKSSNENITLVSSSNIEDETHIDEPYLILKPKRRTFKGKIIYD